MCFSATASFVAGIALSTVGIVTLRKPARKADIPFAAIPLLFGIQQIIEGLLWLSFRFDAALLNATATYAFSVYSHTLWPIFVPFSVWCFFSAVLSSIIYLYFRSSAMTRLPALRGS